MRKIITKILITFGIAGAVWFVATIECLNIVPVLGLIVSAISFPASWCVGADYITENFNEEGDEDEDYGTVCDLSELWSKS